ncbi:unnamed protein product [Rotaria magnacalcarata]|uniref:Transposase Tc1-like domain-containing protein n=1 Tax=Rotaria magnacalcarata TaxID=392030 RepID=A0A815U1Q9_9BILA|nr:unnamed protein product [Rotaria magnacalcarata]CAF5101681.1 unnamed protein product [Rotaria magnacalcarata]
MSLPLHKRYEIIFLGKNRHEPHFGIKKIAKILKCSTSTVKRWLSRWKTDKYLDDHIREGRPRLQNHSLNVSERTVRRRLHEAGLQYSLPLSKPFLTSKHRQDRLQWATQVQNLDWNKIIATDETTFRLNTVRRMCWQLRDHRTVRRTVTHPMKINLWGCMTSKGFDKIICFKENLKSHFLCTQIYQNGLLPTARHYFGRRKD